MSFLPVNRQEMLDRGWDELDFVYISGDAYVDHPSFGHAIIARVLESEGYRVGMIAQPDWNHIEDFTKLGKPKLGVLISSGVIDSMVNHYTASKKPRSDDAYSPGGKAGFRPDRAVIVYCNKARQAFKDVPIIIGGIEASLRRFAHYDYWDNRVRRSILQDSKADLLIYGMGEVPIVQIANLLKQGTPIHEIQDVRGTAYLAGDDTLPWEIRACVEAGKDNKSIAVVHSFEEVEKDKVKYAEAFKVQYDEQDALTGKTLVQRHGDRYLIQNPPALPLDVSEMDRIYALPYERTYHPMYEKQGGIPAIREVEFSITSHRGCYGGCSFCALNFHQGRVIQNRSQASVINEAKKLTWLPGFKGYIHDIGGPTANFRSKACEKQVKSGVCKGKQCLHPEPCKNLIADHSEYLSLLRKLRDLPEVKKVFIRSGIRYDYLMLDKNDDFFMELCEHHVSGQLKVAPEHVVDSVLEKMGKPGRKVYDRFVKKFYEINKKIDKEQYLVPYMISSHPGSDLKAAVELAEYLRDQGHMPEQVQDFYPTPGTLSTCMFYTGLDARNMKKVYVPKSPREKAMQRALLQYRKKENYDLVYQALKIAGRDDLIGFGPKCLIRPMRVMKKLQEKEGSKIGSAGKEKRSKDTFRSEAAGKVNKKKEGSKSGDAGNRNRNKESIKSGGTAKGSSKKENFKKEKNKDFGRKENSRRENNKRVQPENKAGRVNKTTRGKR